MAIHHYYTILCEHLIRADDGKLSCIGLYHNIHRPSFPGQFRLKVVVGFVGAAGDDYAVTLEGPEGFAPIEIARDEVGPQPQGDIPHRHAVMNLVADTQVGLPRPGSYAIVLRSGEVIANRCEFGVIHVGGEGKEASDG